MSAKKTECNMPFGMSLLQIISLVLLAVFLIWPIYSFLWSSLLDWLKNNSVMAGWVQAFGVVTSFAAALLISRYERNHAVELLKKSANEEAYKNRKVATILVKRLCQTMLNTIPIYMKGEGYELIDVKSRKALLNLQVNQLSRMPLDSLSIDEQQHIAYLQDSAIQLVEHLLFAENFYDKNENDDYHIHEKPHLILCEWVIKNHEEIRERINELQSLWEKESTNFYKKLND